MGLRHENNEIRPAKEKLRGLFRAGVFFVFLLTKDNHEAVSRPAGSIQPERPLHHHRHTAQKGRRREGGGRSNPRPQGLLAFPEPAPRRDAVHRHGYHHGLGRSVPAGHRASVAPRSICTFNTWPRPRKGPLPAGPRPPTRPATWPSSGPISWMPDKTPSPPARPPFGLSKWNCFEDSVKWLSPDLPYGRCRFRVEKSWPSGVLLLKFRRQCKISHPNRWRPPGNGPTLG